MSLNCKESLVECKRFKRRNYLVAKKKVMMSVTASAAIAASFAAADQADDPWAASQNGRRRHGRPDARLRPEEAAEIKRI